MPTFNLTTAFYCILLLAANVAASRPAIHTTAPIIDLGYAKYQGFIDDQVNITRFLGIRYAAQPLGNLRFREPQAPFNTSALQQADIQPPRCPQGIFNPFPPSETPATPLHPESEDCLFLNVYVPGTIDHSEKLPVLVWIHGGGYIQGSATGWAVDDIQNGDDFIRESGNGVVVVVIQYRLGIFGFLSGEEVKAGGALNSGLLDQQFSLRWVQKHISKFGGEPTNVAIWGQSAGAGSVLQHVIANGGRTTPPLFKNAIMSSSFLPSQYVYNDPIPQAQYNQAISLANCSTSENTLECLRAADISVLRSVNNEITLRAFYGTTAFSPVIDGTFITQRPTQALRQRKLNGNALYSVTNAFEGSLFVNFSTADTIQIPDYVAGLFPKLSSQEISAAVAHYAGLGAPIDQAVAIRGEAILICPTYYMLRAFPGHAYKGEFAIPPGMHGQDLSYYFPSMNANGVPDYNNTDFDTAFTDSFLTFAKTSNPNKYTRPKNITPFWRTWAPGNVEMVFNKTENDLPVVKSITTSSALLDRCAFWESVSAHTAQ